jgi:biopolymer transport protein ExbB/TolQ
MNPLATFAHFFKTGGPFMYAVLIAALTIVALVAERFWVIARAGSINTDKLTRDVLSRVAKGDTAAAADLCRRVKGPVASVTHAILLRGDADEERLRNAADGAASVVLPPLTRRLSYLAMLANTCTLLGLLGTIFGLITAFSAVGASDPAQRGAFLAAGISEAMNTTAFGLLVAIPTLLIHGFLAGRVEGIFDSVDSTAARVIEALHRRGAKSHDLAA